MTCAHGEGCPRARCMVLALCAARVTGVCGEPPKSFGHASSLWCHAAAKWAMARKYDPEVYEYSAGADGPAIILAWMTPQIADRWMRWFRDAGPCARCGISDCDGWVCWIGHESGMPTAHLLDDFADEPARRSMTWAPCRLDHAIMPPSELRQHLGSPDCSTDWGPLLVARDWLLERGLEPDMWRQVHAFR